MMAYALWILVVGGGSNFTSADNAAAPYVVPFKFVHVEDCQAVQKAMTRLAKKNPPSTQCVRVLIKD